MRGIRRKIILNTTVISFILAVVASLILMVTANRLIDNSMTTMLAPFARTAAKSVESNLHLMADRIDLIAQSDTFTNKLQDKVRLQGVLDNAAAGIEFSWLAVYSPDGTLLTGSSKSPASIADSKIYSQMNGTQNMVIDDTAVTDHGLEIAVGRPILLDGSVSCYIIGSYKYDVLNDIISNIQIGQNYSAWIVNADGLIVAHSDTGIVSQKSKVTQLFQNDEAMLSLLEKISTGITGSEIVPIQKAQSVVAYSPVRGANWQLVITVPKSEFMTTAISAIELNVLVLTVLLAVSTIITLRFSGNVSKSLGIVTARIQKLANGDLSSTVDVLRTRDEAETLSVALKNSILDINGYMSKLTDALEQLSSGNADIAVAGEFRGDFIVMKDALNNIIDYLNSILSYLKQSSSDLSDSTRMVADRALMVQRATENQVSSARHLEEETKAIAKGTGLIGENANKTHDLMTLAAEQLGNGREQMRNTLLSMADIRNSANDITAITKLMEDIAFQTKLLALNAAIEAARAGAAGAGFSVVADQVRHLASQSEESAKQTAAMIDQTQKSVAAGADYAQKTSDIIEQVAGISQNIFDIADALALSVQNTNEALGQVSCDIASISKFAQENLESGSELASQSEEMALQAEKLSDMASKFRLRAVEKGGILHD